MGSANPGNIRIRDVKHRLIADSGYQWRRNGTRNGNNWCWRNHKCEWTHGSWRKHECVAAEWLRRPVLLWLQKRGRRHPIHSSGNNRTQPEAFDAFWNCGRANTVCIPFNGDTKDVYQVVRVLYKENGIHTNMTIGITQKIINISKWAGDAKRQAAFGLPHLKLRGTKGCWSVRDCKLATDGMVFTFTLFPPDEKQVEGYSATSSTPGSCLQCSRHNWPFVVILLLYTTAI